MKPTGITLWAVGIMAFIIGMMLPTTVPTTTSFGELPSAVSNIGLLQQQMIVIHAGLVLFLAGVFLHGISLAIDQICSTGYGLPTNNILPSSRGEGTATDLPLNAPTSQEIELAEEMTRFNIRRVENGHYRYRNITFDTLENAIKEARRDTLHF